LLHTALHVTLLSCAMTLQARFIRLLIGVLVVSYTSAIILNNFSTEAVRAKFHQLRIVSLLDALYLLPHWGGFYTHLPNHTSALFVDLIHPERKERRVLFEYPTRGDRSYLGQLAFLSSSELPSLQRGQYTSYTFGLAHVLCCSPRWHYPSSIQLQLIRSTNPIEHHLHTITAPSTSITREFQCAPCGN
jgi:hypothetical protein